MVVGRFATACKEQGLRWLLHASGQGSPTIERMGYKQSFCTRGAFQQAASSTSSSTSQSSVQQAASQPVAPTSPAASAAVAPALADKAASGLSAAEGATPSGLAAVPPVVKALGFAGAIPFLALSPPIAAAIPILPADVVQHAALLQIGYGASILSFLGGVHWGTALAQGGGALDTAKHNVDRYLWGVTPCLMSWPALMLDPGPAAFIVTCTLGITYMVDRTFAQKNLLPKWYMGIRLPLTLLASSGLLLTTVHAFRTEYLELEERHQLQDS